MCCDRTCRKEQRSVKFFLCHSLFFFFLLYCMQTLAISCIIFVHYLRLLLLFCVQKIVTFAVPSSPIPPALYLFSFPSSSLCLYFLLCKASIFFLILLNFYRFNFIIHWREVAHNNNVMCCRKKYGTETGEYKKYNRQSVKQLNAMYRIEHWRLKMRISVYIKNTLLNWHRHWKHGFGFDITVAVVEIFHISWIRTWWFFSSPLANNNIILDG